jgi:flagellar biosynthesis/type III secretory pathway protein FliH
MRGRIALERFCSLQPDERPDDRSCEGAGRDAPAPPADTKNIMLPEADPEAARQACLERISRALEITASEQAGLRAQCIGDVATAFGAAAETLLPRLAQAGFAALVAETAQTIARHGHWPDLLLSVAPENATAAADALANTGPGTDIRITENPTLGADEARIEWRQGGAEIDVEALASTALDQYRLRIDGGL